jgi:hypothetical protein
MDFDDLDSRLDGARGRTAKGASRNGIGETGRVLAILPACDS